MQTEIFHTSEEDDSNGQVKITFYDTEKDFAEELRRRVLDLGCEEFGHDPEDWRSKDPILAPTYALDQPEDGPITLQVRTYTNETANILQSLVEEYGEFQGEY